MRYVTGAVIIVLVLVFAAFLYYQSPSYPPSSPASSPVAAGVPPVPAPKVSFVPGTGTNLAASAEDFSGGKWHPKNLTVAAGTTKAPDGSVGAYNLTETTANGRHRSETIIAGLTPGSSYTLSIFIRPAGRHLMEFEMRDKTPGKYSVVRFEFTERCGTSHMLYFGDPTAIPQVYDPDARYDGGHLDEKGAELWSALLAESMAKVLQQGKAIGSFCGPSS